jgi:hypothetical protein
MNNKCLKESCKGSLVFERVNGIPGYTCDTCDEWFHKSSVDGMGYTKMSKSESTASNMMVELSVESKLKAMTSERDYWKLRHNMLLKYGGKEI